MNLSRKAVDLVASFDERRHPRLAHLLMALAYPMLMYLCQYAVVVVAVMAGFDIYGSDILVAADLLIIAALLLIILCSGKRIAPSLAMNKVAPSRVVLGFIAGIGLTCALNYLMVWVESAFPKVMEEYGEHMDSAVQGSALSYILAGVILAPLVEELLFRALSLRHFDSVLPRGLSILLVSLVFGLMHSNLVQGIYAGSLGILLSCLYLAYESIWVSIAVHFGFNIVSIIALVDTEGMSEAQFNLFAAAYGLFSMAATVIGLTALVFLLVGRKHPIWFKKRRECKKEKKEIER